MSENKLLLMSDEKSPARNFHRLIALNRSGMELNMHNGRILVVEDEKDIREGLGELLRREGYTVVECGSAAQAKRYAAEGGVELYLLDVMLPDGSGFELCTYIREELRSEAPVIFLTALDDEDSVVKGLSLGGNDYLGKPFRKRELMARVGAHLNRYHKSNVMYNVGDLSYDKAAGRVFKGGQELELRRNELRLLSCFMENPGILIPRERLLELMWDIDGEFVDDNTLSVAISRLRKKIGRWKDREYIDTVRGIGYRWNERGNENE